MDCRSNNRGNIVSGQGTNSIVIDWSATNSGLYTSAITLIETDNQTSCSGNNFRC